MIGAISGTYSYYNAYTPYMTLRGNQQAEEAQPLHGSQRAAVLTTGRRASSPDTPVEPVRPVTSIKGDEVPAARLGPVIREGADPAEMAVRMRIQPYEEEGNIPGDQKAAENSGGEQKIGAEGAQAAVEEGKCQTCEKRKYQDESDDMGVSFQTPTSIAPEQVAAAVRGHENEHVVREQAKARMEDRKVVSQSVTLHTDICPECGKVYVSGGTTRTVTAAENNPAEEAEKADQASQEKKAFSVFG